MVLAPAEKRACPSDSCVRGIAFRRGRFYAEQKDDEGG